MTKIFSAAAAKLLQSCPTLCNPIDAAHQAPPSLGFSRQEHWSGLPFPSPVHESEKWKWRHSVVSDSRNLMDCSLPGSSVHGIFQARVLEWGAIAFSEFSLDVVKCSRGQRQRWGRLPPFKNCQVALTWKLFLWKCLPNSLVFQYFFLHILSIRNTQDMYWCYKGCCCSIMKSCLTILQPHGL